MMREVSVSLVAVAGFGLVLWWSGVSAAAERALSLSTAGLTAMLDGDLDDRAKEVAVRRAGLGLVATSLGVLWRLCGAIAAALAPIMLADLVGLAARDSVFALMLRWDYVVIVSLVAMVLAAVARRWLAATADDHESDRYSVADRFFHGLAFASPGVLTTASRLEDRLLATSAAQPAAPPVFITSLARAGTTPVLNALHDVPGIATHTYRDMPFLTAPTLWNRLAGGRRRRVDRRERAHGDGLEIDLDSPEAFEEVVWKLFWPEKFGPTSIALWRVEDGKYDAERFLERHMGKVVHARRVQGPDDAVYDRYCSKNNANIARIPYLLHTFPGCRIVVPVRRPECHAASLLRQHVNFSTLHDEDLFVRRYMRDIGHFEFGPIHRPIWFRGFDPDRHDPATGDYWLHYWIHAFREVLEHDDCILVSQDDLRSSPRDTMAKLCDALDLAQPSLDFRSYFHATPDEAPTDGHDRTLYAEAVDVYDELEARAL